MKYTDPWELFCFEQENAKDSGKPCKEPYSITLTLPEPDSTLTISRPLQSLNSYLAHRIWYSNPSVSQVDAAFSKNPVFLPQVYAALCQSTGPSSDSYDHHKGTYNFDFLMTLQKGELSQLYCFRVMHVRSSIEIFLYQIVSPEVERTNSAAPPLVPVSQLTQTIANWLRELVQKLGPTKDFVRSASCDALILGCLDQEYFIERLNDIEIFEKVVKVLKAKIEKGAY